MELELNPLFKASELAERVKELAHQIQNDYNGEPLVCVGVLKGSIIFLSDLIRNLNLPVSIEFIGCASYEGTKSTGHVQITTDLTADIKDKNVLLVEDIVDTGMTIDYILNTLRVREPKSLKICALLSKPDSHIMKHKLDYVGFEISKEFVVGYGLDYNGRYRELPYVAQVKS